MWSVNRLLLLIIMLCVLAAPARTQMLQSGSMAPDFTRTDLDGHSFTLSSLRGNVVLLNFWATWCAPCQAEMPRFDAWQQNETTQGLRVVGISIDDESAPVLSLRRKLGIHYPLLMGDTALAELYGGVLGVPITLLIDRTGKIRARWSGEADLSQMESAIHSLLAEPFPNAHP